MKTKSNVRWITWLSIFIVFVMACTFFTASPETSEPPQPEATETQAEVESTTPPGATATEPEQVTSEPATEVPTVAPTVAPPPQPVRPSAQSSNSSGTCGSGETYDCSVAFTDGFPMQFILLKDGQEIGAADGVQSVDFRVDQNGNTIYSTTENNAAYCMFGGDGPCSWILEDNVYKWGSGGPPIEAGDYKVNIDAIVNTADGDFNFHWDADVTISLQ